MSGPEWEVRVVSEKTGQRERYAGWFVSRAEAEQWARRYIPKADWDVRAVPVKERA